MDNGNVLVEAMVSGVGGGVDGSYDWGGGSGWSFFFNHNYTFIVLNNDLKEHTKQPPQQQ